MATQNEYGREFRTTMQVIRKKYKYNNVHTTDSIKCIITELANADSIRILKEAPAPNEIAPRGSANVVSDSVSVLQKLMQGPASIYLDFDEYETANAAMADSECSIETKRRRSHKINEKEKKLGHRSSSRHHDRPNKDDTPTIINCPTARSSATGSPIPTTPRQVFLEQEVQGLPIQNNLPRDGDQVQTAQRVSTGTGKISSGFGYVR